MNSVQSENFIQPEMIICVSCEGEGSIRVIMCCGNFNSTGCCLCPKEIGIVCADCNGEGTISKGILSAKNSGII